MKVVHLVPSIGPHSGGMGSGTLATARAQKDAGLDTSIWCADDAEVAIAQSHGIHVVPLPVVGPRKFAFTREGKRLALTAEANVVHQNGLWTAQSQLTEVFRSRGIPTVVAPHGSLAPYARRRSWWKKSIALAVFESRNLRRASCLHATSEEELRGFRDFGLRAPIALVPNAVLPSWLSAAGDGDRFRRKHGLGTDTRVMLFLSRIHPIKGLPMLIEALSAQRDRLRGWHVVIAGPDEAGHRAEIERQAARLGVADMLQFVGNVQEDEKRDAFEAADLFVLPTHSENFGIVVAEALACGIPVLTTQGAPWRELQLRECGWWVPVNARAIAEALVDAARRRPAELRLMGARGRALVAQRYIWSAVAERTVSLYNWLCGNSPQPDFVVVD